MAVVFRALDERLSRRVALKIMGPELAADAAFRRRFIGESRAAAAVDDPHIIPVFEAGEADGVLFIAMRLVRDGDVRSLIEAQGMLPALRAGWIVSAVASALDAAHGQGLVHRDVKPANMLLDARPGRPDHVYLSDFGLSKDWQGSTGLTGTGVFLGTLDYAAPEQIKGLKVDGRTDQYALGCAAYELLAGKPPFRRDQGLAVLYAQLSEPPPALTERRAGLAPAVDQVFARVLAKSAGDRYASCGEFADALRSALGLPAYDAGSQDTPPPGQLATVITPQSPDAPDSQPGGEVAGDAGSGGGQAAAQVAGGPPGGAAATGSWPDLAGDHAQRPAEEAARPAGEQAQREAVGNDAETVGQIGEDLTLGSVQEPRPDGGAETLRGPGPRPGGPRPGGRRISRRAIIIAAGAAIAVTGLIAAIIIVTGAGPTPHVRWSYATGLMVDSSPAVAGGTVYIASQDKEVYALDAATGHLRWTYTAGGDIFTSSPVVAGGTVYVGSDDHKVYALNAATGHLRWTHTTGGNVDSSPAVAGGTVYIGSDDHNVYALNAATGHTRWTYPTGGSIESSPAVAGGTVYIGSTDDKVYALNAATGHTRWTYTTGGSIYSSPAVAGGTVYIGSNDLKVYALDAATGHLRWTHTTGGGVGSRPAVAGGTVYIGSTDHKVYALNAATGHLRWTYTTGGYVDSSPAVAGSTVYIGSYDHNVYALNAATGQVRWTYTTGGNVYSSPAVAGSTVYIGSEDDKVYALDAKL